MKPSILVARAVFPEVLIRALTGQTPPKLLSPAAKAGS
jgi:hypothetical protein